MCGSRAGAVHARTMRPSKAEVARHARTPRCQSPPTPHPHPTDTHTHPHAHTVSLKEKKRGVQSQKLRHHHVCARTKSTQSSVSTHTVRLTALLGHDPAGAARPAARKTVANTTAIRRNGMAPAGSARTVVRGETHKKMPRRNNNWTRNPVFSSGVSLIIRRAWQRQQQQQRALLSS